MQGVPTREYVLEHLNEAMEKGWIKPFYQPVIRSISRRLCGMEALARWDDPVYGLLPPARFISVLEDAHQIHLLDLCVIRQVCARIRKNMEEKSPIHIPISVNLSRLDYELCDIFLEVEQAIEEYQVPRSILCIEVTESVLNQHGVKMYEDIDHFRRAGYQVWMDDFGSGYSSLNVLKDYQFDELKVDMRFLDAMHLRSQKILSSIIHMAKEIGIQTLAEGVETEDQFRFLRNIGCEKVQGYLFGRPMPFEECIEHIKGRGIEVEPPVLRGYYDEMGKLDVLSAVPFLSREERDEADAARGQNSLPIALLEVEGDEVRLLFNNEAFDEASGEIDWFDLFGDIATDPDYRDAIRLSNVSTRLHRLLEETHSTGVSKMYFVESDQYFMIQAKQIASGPHRWAVLLKLENLSRGAQISRQVHLDEGLRKIYGIYDQVLMMDLEKGVMTHLYTDAKEVNTPEEGLFSVQSKYAAEWIFPEDRPRFMSFVDPATLAGRVGRSRHNFVSSHLRSLGYRGDYVWKIHIIVHVHAYVYFLLVRESETEVLDFLSLTGRNQEDELFSNERLWVNFIQNSPMKVFWKDAQRRFKGASRSFLDFYGFPSLSTILGKTDEDMGWHLHPDNYEDVEWQVLNEGKSTYLVPGDCIVRGQNCNIVASKMPLYDMAGKIVGLIGYFFLSAEAPQVPNADGYDGRRDSLTGLLNAQGIWEEMYAYRDEYDLRGVDFAWIEISIEGFGDIVRLYGKEFGDDVIRKVGSGLLSVCGSRASVGRMNGGNFVVLHQFRSLYEINRYAETIRSLASHLNQVEGTPFSLYTAIGMSFFSETGDTEELSKRAHLRMMTADNRILRHSQFREDMHRMFSLYDYVPMACAVLQILRKEEDAVILYVNPKLVEDCKLNDANSYVGRRMREVLACEYDRWKDMALAAAYEGERSERSVYFASVGKQLRLMLEPVVGEGYCLFSYQEESGAAGLPEETPVSEPLEMPFGGDAPAEDLPFEGIAKQAAELLFKEFAPEAADLPSETLAIQAEAGGTHDEEK